MLLLLIKADPGQTPLFPHLTVMEAIDLEALLHQNKIPLLRNLIPLAKGQAPPDQDPICEPQGLDLQPPKAINIGISLLKAIGNIGGENFSNCNFHPILKKKMKPAIGNSC